MSKKSKIASTLLFPLSIALLAGCGETPTPTPTPDPEPQDGLTGEGTEANPYKLNEAQDLLDLNAVVLAGTSNNAITYVDVEKDIDATGTEFNGIGNLDHIFTTYFNGKNHTIKGIKLNKFDKDQKAYGFINVASNSIIYNLNIEYDVAIEAKGVGCFAYAGGVVGYGSNVYLKNVHGKGNVDVESYSSQANLIAGGLIGMNSLGSAAYVTAFNVSHEGDAIAYKNGETTGLSYAGGIVGYLSTGNGQAIYAIASAFNKGSVKADDAAGGILARADFYTSIQDAYTTGEEIATFAPDGSYAGGIVGISGYETYVANTFAEYDSIEASKGSTAFPSMAGGTVGYFALDSIDEGDTDGVLGTANYNNASKITRLVGDKEGLSGVKLTDSSYAKIDEVVDFVSFENKDNKPSLIKSKEFGESATVTLNHNYQGSTSETIDVKPGAYDYLVVSAIEAGPSEARKGYSFFSYFYDSELKAQYRFYAPFISSVTLYAAWGDTSTIVGTYEYSITWGSTTTVGTWVITDQYFYWINPYYETFTYTYSYYKSQLVLHSVEGEKGDYDNETIIVNEDGTLTAHDINEYDAIYTGTKQAKDYVFPDYTGECFLGHWYANNSSNAEFELYANGNGSGFYISPYSGNKMVNTGGFRVESNNMDIKISQIAFGQFKYDATNDIIYNATTLFSRSKVNTKITSSDSKAFIYITEDNHKYVIFDGAISSYTGTLEENNEIVISNNTYVYKNGSLVLKGSEPDDPVNPDEPTDPDDPVETSMFGSWQCVEGSTTYSVTLNEDGTGTYQYSGGSEMTIVFNTETGVITGGSFCSSFDADDSRFYINSKGQLVLHYSQDFGDQVFEKTFTKVA